MATKRTIQSPGVEIREFDLSERLPAPLGTSIYITGFANQGPTDEVNQVNSIAEFESTYGKPTNASERYFYHTVKGVLQSPGVRASVNRLPYGSAAGTGFGSYYTALVFPTQFYNPGQSGTIQTTNLTINDATSAAFAIQGSNGLLYAITYRSEASTAVTTLTSYVNSQGGVVANVTGTVGSTTSFAAAIANYFESLNPNIFDIGISGSTVTFTNSAIGTVTYAPSGVTTKTTTTITTPGTTTSSGNLTTNLNGVSGVYFLGKPEQFSITKDEYQSIVNGSGFTWSSTASAISAINSVATFGNAGMIIVNKAQTVIDQSFKGYYIGLVDNVDADNIGSSFNKIQTALTVTQTAVGGLTNYTTIPSSVLTFNLTAASGSTSDSISYVLETASRGYIIGNDPQYDDVLNLGVFKLNNSVFLDDPNKLVYSPQELYTGSFTDPFRQTAPLNGGQPVTYSLQNIIADRSPNITMLVNPYITNQAVDSLGKGTSLVSTLSTKTLKKVRTINNNMVVNYATLSSFVGFDVPLTSIQTLTGTLGYVDSLLPLGTYSPTGPDNAKIIGNLPDKLSRSLSKIKDDEIYDIDMLVEGGLGTIYAYTQIGGVSAYDDTVYNSAFETALSAIQKTTNTTGTAIQTNYNAVINEFLGVANTYQNGGRGDTFFIADPIRQIFVKGQNTKVMEDSNTVFSRDVYWALRNLYNTTDTSYAATFANWVAVIDGVTNVKTWVPSSGFVAARMAATDDLIGPWIAPAGFNRGILQGIVDIAWSPNQRQRDDLYKARLNPIAQFPGQGNVIYGQKTLQTKPSAFDRINVRRGFLYYEKAVKNSMKFFVFEPNTEYTRNRVLAVINPFFERIKSAQGVYDFLVVCDDRNNTPDTIDENELIIDIYLKPVRAAEFILVNFYATRTSASFEELVARA